MEQNNATIYRDGLTSNGPLPFTIAKEDWLKRSHQISRLHPLDPNGVCMSCGAYKLGWWQWVPWEPE